MAAPAKINFKVYQGSTFQETLRWESSVKVYKPISAVTKSAPAVITATAHEVPVGWRVKVTNLSGMTELNSNDVYHTVTSVTTDDIIINALNTLAYKDYVSGGVIEYNQPIDLTGFTARMQLRNKLEDETILHELTTENSGISINTIDSTVNLLISATDTASFTFSTAVYSLELVSSGGIVTPFANGTLSLVKEVTR